MTAAIEYVDAAGERLEVGRSYCMRYGPLKTKTESYQVLAAEVVAIEPGHRRGGPIKMAYRTPGLLAANRTGWRRPEELYRNIHDAAFVEMPAEDITEW